MAFTTELGRPKSFWFQRKKPTTVIGETGSKKSMSIPASQMSGPYSNPLATITALSAS
jgi:hypothetical protein